MPEAPQESRFDVAVLGGGITGLAAALRASERGLRALVIEKEAETGGIWRSVARDGFIFDLGVHGLYAATTDNEATVASIRALARDGFVETEKRTKILFRGRLLNYPLVASEFFTQYGAAGFCWALTLLAARARVSVAGHAWMRSFRDYIVGNFGATLNRIYFEPYVRKVWGVDPGDLSLEAIARRVRRIRVREFAWHWIRRSVLRRRAESYEGLQPARFLYPREGAGTVVDAFRRAAESRGAVIRTRSRVASLRQEADGYALRVETPDGVREVGARHVISTLPLPHLLALLFPPPNPRIEEIARGLRYRGIRMLCLLLDREKVFDAQWIYFQGDEFAFSRINEFKNLSPAFCPAGTTSLAIEYNCDPGEPLWELPDDVLAEQALAELDRCRGVGTQIRVALRDAFSVRIEHAYPVMRVGTHDILAAARRCLAAFPRLDSIGRQGRFDYINGDECVRMAFDTVAKISSPERERSRPAGSTRGATG